MREIREEETVIVEGDLDRHVEKREDGYEKEHGGQRVWGEK